MQKMTVRIPKNLCEKLSELIVKENGMRSQNQVINDALRWYLSIISRSAHEEVSWRLGEAEGLNEAAKWIKRRVSYYSENNEKEDYLRRELLWIAQVFSEDSRKVLNHANNLKPSFFRYKSSKEE